MTKHSEGCGFSAQPASPELGSTEQGHTQAQVRLAQLFAKGLTDIAPDQVQAYQWMSLAAASGEPTAAKVVADYAAQMKPEQLQQAQLLAEEWQRRQGTK